MKLLTSIFIITIISGCFGVTPQKTDKKGKQIPEFSFLLADSVTWINTKDITPGKPIALLYFSPYCPYCRALTNEITEEIDELKNIQFYFLSPFPLSAIKAFSIAHQLAKYPNITTAFDTSHIAKEYFDVPGIPYLAIYNKEKKLNQAFLGKISANQIKKVAEE